MKLRGVEAENNFQNKQLPLNDKNYKFDKKFNNNNYNITVKKFHDAGWKKSYLTSANVAIIGHKCGVSQYPKLYYQQLEKYQFLTR